MKIASSMFCEELGYFLNCEVEDGEVTRVHISAKPEHQVEENEVLSRIADFLKSGSGNIESIPVKIQGTEFQEDVWNALREIPKGEVRTYSEIATRIGRPRAARAVGNAVGSNRITILVPCHRVVASGGMGGFSAIGGVETKKKILDAEKRSDIVKK